MAEVMFAIWASVKTGSFMPMYSSVSIRQGTTPPVQSIDVFPTKALSATFRRNEPLSTHVKQAYFHLWLEKLPRNPGSR